MIRLFLAGLALLLSCMTANAQQDSLQPVLQEHRELIAKSSRKTIAPAIDAIATSGVPQAQMMLEQWAKKNIWMRKSDGLFFVGEKRDAKTYALVDIDTALTIGEVEKSDLKQLKPNSGVRAMIQTALVQFQLSDPDPFKRQDALTSIARDPEAALLSPLRASIEGETDATLKAQKQRLERLLTIGYDKETKARVAAIKDVSGDLGVDVRGALNPLLVTSRDVSRDGTPEGHNIARRLVPGSDVLPQAEAYALLVSKGLAPALTTPDDMRAALADNIEDGHVGGVPVVQLSSDEARNRAYATLAEAGIVPAFVPNSAVQAAVEAHVFFETYNEPSAEVTGAAHDALETIELKVAANQVFDLTLDALSLASIYFLAAIGLAITFGVMGVINMAHGEFIMMGAYTGYVVQQIIPDHTVSILVAIPLAFAVTFAAGIAMERLVIRWLYSRPLETLLATFGISIALQQLAKNIFGTQARPLTSPGWLDGALVLNDVVSISFIRIAIFFLALLFLCVFLFIMKHTRLGLETRAVTQNPRMAASMGINPGRVNMLTFGLGSGIAGVAGVAIGLFAKVTSELGSDYIVQSFMTVVVGGVGNIWGTLAGAAMIGFLQKGIEWLNPSNTLAAQTYMIIFIIIFIQFRPRGIIALKGRAAGD